MVPFLPVRGTDICPDNALIPWTWVQETNLGKEENHSTEMHLSQHLSQECKLKSSQAAPGLGSKKQTLAKKKIFNFFLQNSKFFRVILKKKLG